MDLRAPVAEEDHFYRGGQAETLRHHYLDCGGTETDSHLYFSTLQFTWPIFWSHARHSFTTRIKYVYLYRVYNLLLYIYFWLITMGGLSVKIHVNESCRNCSFKKFLKNSY